MFCFSDKYNTTDFIYVIGLILLDKYHFINYEQENNKNDKLQYIPGHWER